MNNKCECKINKTHKIGKTHTKMKEDIKQEEANKLLIQVIKNKML